MPYQNYLLELFDLESVLRDKKNPSEHLLLMNMRYFAQNHQDYVCIYPDVMELGQRYKEVRLTKTAEEDLTGYRFIFFLIRDDVLNQ